MNKEQIQYLKDNISAINGVNFDPANTGIGGLLLFGSKTDFKTAMKRYFTERLSDDEFNQTLQREFRDENYIKARILDIANRHLILKADLITYYDSILQQSVKNEIDKAGFVANAIEYIKNNMNNEYHYKYTATSLKKILEKQYDFIFSNGFPSNIQNINTGIMTANAGDSAQFLFLARAILAGFNCSNVDVRSSKYDAVVDYNNTLLRIQIKGASGNSISFKDRDRGGQGIDHHHIRNQGQRITAEHCDIYAAVDKQVGICYLIPMSYVEKIDDADITNVSLNSLDRFKENWDIISEVASEKNKRI
ncbi:hypothetical protein [Flavobacterium sp. H122]|uniref:hypothetical protein n=1 Tax=Flavobacterium sp. H122 TaxID=2529860 RepID=UPI001B7D7CB0|nr:hypothetical protein [Flavobacterium sp. H122]